MSAISRAEFLEHVTQALSDPATVEALLGERTQVLESVGLRLGRWRALDGVPFSHLVPDEDMLPAESIRWFGLDPDWLAALIDGACSPGRRSGELGRTIETVVMPIVERSADEWARKRGLTSGDEPVRASDGSVVTGFLLRSRVVQAWKDLALSGYAKGSDRRLPLLRFERLSPSVLIALFSGALHRIELHEPPQALHFGIDDEGGKSLRSDAGRKLAGRAVDVPYRDARRRVLDVAALANGLGLALDPTRKDDPSRKDGLPASDFALQMLQGVGSVSFLFDVDE